MEAATLFQSSFPTNNRSVSGFGSTLLLANPSDRIRYSTPFIKRCPLTSRSRPAQQRNALGHRRSSVVKASSVTESNDSNGAGQVAPLKLESKIGQFLSDCLVHHPHLLPAAIEFQLEQLKADRATEEQKDQPSSTGTDIVLYRRIAEVKANERRQALEEILYALTVQKFMDANVSLTPTIAVDAAGQVETFPEQNSTLEQLHSPEALEMIHNHLALILGARANDENSVAEISRLRIGQVYAASVMYGYFLKRVDQRFQLEKAVKVLPQASDEVVSDVQQSMGQDAGLNYDESAQSLGSHPEVAAQAGGISPGGFGYGIKPSRLRTYVMAFDGETLQKYATIRSKEAVTIIEKHTEALFGRPEILIKPDGTIDSSNDPKVRISFGGLKRLILEAVTFGSFLWDVESYVDSRYHFVAS
uniref:Uncharacterized protein n=1 Tax=Kalanchoe fedtschenkoi TaxID=63787 RepID=A0A7N0V982_KALFE